MNVIGLRTELRHFVILETSPGNTTKIEVTEESYKDLQRLWVSRKKKEIEAPVPQEEVIVVNKSDWMDQLISEAETVKVQGINNSLGSISDISDQDLDGDQL